MFRKENSDSQVFDLKEAFTSPSPSLDISGFTSAPRGAFAGQEIEFKRQRINQLAKDREALVLRGDPRPIHWILTHGVLPKSVGSPVHVENHRSTSEGSGGVSWTTCASVAVASGANAARATSYGSTPVVGRGRFFVLAAKVNGSQQDAAGPSSRLKPQEQEVTVAGGLAPSSIVGFRKCKLINPQLSIAKCSSIFARADLNQQEKEQVISALSGKSIRS